MKLNPFDNLVWLIVLGCIGFAILCYLGWPSKPSHGDFVMLNNQEPYEHPRGGGGYLYSHSYPPSQRVVIEDGKIYKLVQIGYVKDGEAYWLSGKRWGYVGNVP